MIGLHPVESTISLLESLVAFYHQERMWVYRTRAQLEMGLMQRIESHPGSTEESPEDIQGDGSPTHSHSSPPGQKSSPTSDGGNPADNSSPSPPTKWLKRKKAFGLKLEGISTSRGMLPPVARGGISKHPHPPHPHSHGGHHPHAQHRARQRSNLNPASHPSVSTTATAATTKPTTSFYPPTMGIASTTTLTSPYLSHPSFSFPNHSNPPLPQSPALYPPMSSPQHPSPTHQHQHQQPQTPHPHTTPLVLGAGGSEPTVQILEMFERLMQARMESCERVARLVRTAPGSLSPSDPGSGGLGGAGGSGSAGMRVGGPVGGFGGPVGFLGGVMPGQAGFGIQTQQIGRGQGQGHVGSPQGFPMHQGSPQMGFSMMG
ncbi:hypothetical protein HYDPIDRAFT_164242 [Hydnomerulius pinastri MD-312]|nr:hypothetical protein HYDPIDRAFT_164242 [Hydnomerulius pinastri MD-312]